MEPVASTAVIGIGNEFRRDDGVGWAVVASLQDRAARRPLPPGIVFAQSDGDPGRLIGLWEDTALAVVVDACFPPSSQPGRTHRWSGHPDGSFRSAGPARHSTHGLGLVEALRLGGILERSPLRLVVYAVEGADRSLGAGLTPAVARAVPGLVRRIEADIRGHCAVPAHPPRDERVPRDEWVPRDE
ncbi:hydrogenase maturation protease [Streptomyces wuyuanensis]|uniref:hydrogenase maturation protease n=1 Tax=Streptomyces wuyuanensis TaxID=1196353 RepID=UPI0036A39416